MAGDADVSSAPASSRAEWREQRLRVQQRELPSGRVVVSCPAPYGVGGLGRHLQEIAEALERGGSEPTCLCESGATAGTPDRRRIGVAELTRALRPLVRLSPAWRMWVASAGFDSVNARDMARADHLIAFNGTALAQFRAAVRVGTPGISLMSANSHMRHVLRQHERAHRQYPLERPWATHLLRRNLAEYQLAQRIYVSSDYVRESFIAEGFPEERLVRFPLTPDRRYEPQDPHGAARGASSTFDIVYSGSLVVHKGVPLLVDAFRRLHHADARLVLVGGWKTAGMRRFLERARSQDPRISISPGDPLARLREARLCVHATYEDGFAYAPAEALACGVPVIVSEDTGMKELLDPSRNGIILPTGDRDALTATIDAAYRGEVLSA